MRAEVKEILALILEWLGYRFKGKSIDRITRRQNGDDAVQAAMSTLMDSDAGIVESVSLPPMAFPQRPIRRLPVVLSACCLLQ